MDAKEARDIIESLIFVSDTPVTTSYIKHILGKEAEGHDVEQVINEIGRDYENRQSPIELKFVANGWQLATKKQFGPWVKKLYREKTTLRLSNSALETLSIIAYKQPMSRSEIEEVRGVETSGVLETLLERKLIKIVGRKETIGRPLLYGTTQEFLRHFGLTHLSELPSLDEITPPQQETEGIADESPQETDGEEAQVEDLQMELDQPKSEADQQQELPQQEEQPEEK
jgi:segregation and condensation protein B